MQRRVDRADADADEPAAQRATPKQPREVVVAAPRPPADERDQPREQHRAERREADKPALGERVDEKAVAVREVDVARRVEAFAALAAPALDRLRRDVLVVVEADAEDGKAPPAF